MPTGILGVRGPGEFNTDFRPTNYRELYTMLEPNGSAPLNALLAMGASEETNDPKFNNFRDELPDRVFVVNNAGGYNSSATTIQLASGEDVGFVNKYTVLVNTATGEIMRASADGDTGAYTIAVTRNVGGTSLSISDQDVLAVVGSAYSDGSGSQSPISFDATVAYNYVQIFKTPFGVNNTMKYTYFRTGDKEDEYATKALKLHMMDIERSMLYGRRAIVNSGTSSELRYTGGLLNSITTVEDCASHSTANQWDEDGFDRWLIETCFAWGSKQKVVFCGAKVAGHLQKFAKDRWSPIQIDNTYGINVTGYKTFAGDLMVHLHPQFRQISALASTAIFLDFPYIKYRFAKGRDTHIVENIQLPDEDLVKHQYLTECGLEMLQDKPHAVVKNWKTVP